MRHYVGGSIASSAHGVPRASIDADVVAELFAPHAAPLTAQLRGADYVPEQRVEKAIARRTSFNVIHLETMVKVDVFVSSDRPNDRRAFDRVRSVPVEGGAIPVSSPEDTVLAKLEWFRRGGEVSERQWTDITGLLRTAGTLDVPYLRESAQEIGVADLARPSRSRAAVAASSATMARKAWTPSSASAHHGGRTGDRGRPVIRACAHATRRATGPRCRSASPDTGAAAPPGPGFVSPASGPRPERRRSRG